MRWLQEKAHKKSYRDDVSRIRWFTRHLRGRTLDQVSRDMIDGIISRQLARRSGRTKDLYVALIRAIFRKAMREWEWFEQVPAFRTYTKAGQVRVRYLTQDQAKALLERLPAHQREVVMFALATGLRQGNVLGLTWDRVDIGMPSLKWSDLEYGFWPCGQDQVGTTELSVHYMVRTDLSEPLGH